MDNDVQQAPVGEFVMFTSNDGQVRIEFRFEGDTLWQAMKGQLCGKARTTISEPIKPIDAEGEEAEDPLVRFYRTSAADRKSYNIQSFRCVVGRAAGCCGRRVPKACPKPVHKTAHGLLPDREHGYTIANTATTLSAFLEGNAQPWWLFYARSFYARMLARWGC